MGSQTSGTLRKHEAWVSSLQRLADAAVVILAQVLARYLHHEPWGEQTMTVTVLGLLIFGFAAEVSGLYRPYRMETIAREIRDTLVAWLPVPLALLAFWFFTKTSTQYSRVAASIWFVVAPIMLCSLRASARIGLRVLRAQGHNTRRVAILGCTKDAERLAAALDGAALAWPRPSGCLRRPFRETPARAQAPKMQVLGTSNDLVDQCRKGAIDVVYVALPLRAELRTAGILSELADTTVTVYLVADFLYYSLLRAHWSQVGGIPVVSVHNSPFEGVVAWVKRLEDLVIGSMIVLLTLIPMACIAIAIKVSSPGPVFFRQWRYGLCGKKIRILKFRTMTVCEDGPNVRQVQKNDSRVTSHWPLLATNLAR
jgi:putative colanic acid biosynthesis UDP-glucose lipid carrier transferase